MCVCVWEIFKIGLDCRPASESVRLIDLPASQSEVSITLLLLLASLHPSLYLSRISLP